MRLSFRAQITMLGAVVLVTLAATVGIVVSTLQHTRSALLAQAQTRASDAAHALAREYGVQLLQPQRYASQDGRRPDDDDALSLATGVVLSRERDVEGGFYSAATGDFSGYAFPTHGGPRPKRDLPPAERPLIAEVARRASSSNTDAAGEHEGPADVTLVHASPVRVKSSVVGSAWVMTRMHNPETDDRWHTSALGALVAATALTCVVLAFAIARNLQRGVGRIERGLAGLERDRDARIDTAGEQLELARIGSAVNRLAGVLQSNRARERQIEERLRHAERLAALGRVAAGVAHEVRNPLATMRLRAQMLGGLVDHWGTVPADAAGAARSTSMIIEEIDRLDALVTRMLTLARPTLVEANAIDLYVLVAQRVDEHRARAASHGVRICIAHVGVAAMRREAIFGVSTTAPIVRGDSAQLAQVFDNLIQNALDAMDDGSNGLLTIRVGTSVDGAGARVLIRDTGRGIDAALLERVFEPFFTTRATGTGLGLAISHELAVANGGEIEIESGEGVGTAIVVTFPLDGARE